MPKVPEAQAEMNNNRDDCCDGCWKCLGEGGCHREPCRCHLPCTCLEDEGRYRGFCERHEQDE